MIKTGILGGVFDPVHIGHIIPTLYLLNNNIVDKIMIIPCKDQPLKKRISTPFDIRYKMAESVFGKYKNIEINSIENHLPSPSYTINTIQALKKKRKDEFYIIIGYDEAELIKKWYKYEEIRENANFILIKRNTKVCNIDRDFFKNAVFVNNPVIEISSTNIRKMIKNKKNIDYMIPTCIKKIIDDEGLYIE